MANSAAYLILLAALLSGCTVKVASICPAADPDTVALYQLGHAEMVDRGGQSVFASELGPEAVGFALRGEENQFKDPAPCNSGISFRRRPFVISPPSRPLDPIDPNDAPEYGEIATDPLAGAQEGSVDFWLRIDSDSRNGSVLKMAGVISFDSNTFDENQFSVLIPYEGNRESFDGGMVRGPGESRIVVRYKDGAGVKSLCSSRTFEHDTWHYVGVNLGGNLPIELFVDGQRINYGSEGAAWSQSAIELNCAIEDQLIMSAPTAQVSGVKWVFGALSLLRAPNDADSVGLAGELAGTLSYLRISRRRRDFVDLYRSFGK